MYKKGKKMVKSFGRFLNYHWWIKTAILFIPTIWLPIVVKVIGIHCGLVTQDENFTTRGFIITMGIFLGVLGINLLTSYIAKLDELRKESLKETIEKLKNNIGIYETVTDSIYDICDLKYDALIEYMNSITEKKTCEQPFLNTVRPAKQLKDISRKIAECFCKITGIKEGELVVSMAYCLADTDWKWVDSKDLHGCARLEDLKNNPKSTFYQLKTGKEEFLFLNNKKREEANGRYIFDNKDNSHKRVGSIICEKIGIGSENHMLGEVILSISSYGHMFVESDDEEQISKVEETIRTAILKQFEKRICIQLSNLYIREMYKRFKRKESISGYDDISEMQAAATNECNTDERSAMD